MKNVILSIATVAALLVGGSIAPSTADARPRGWYGGYAYRPYYRSYYRPYYQPYYGGYRSYYPRYSYPGYYNRGYPRYGGYGYGYPGYAYPGYGASWGRGGVYVY